MPCPTLFDRKSQLQIRKAAELFMLSSVLLVGGGGEGDLRGGMEQERSWEEVWGGLLMGLAWLLLSEVRAAPATPGLVGNVFFSLLSS